MSDDKYLISESEWADLKRRFTYTAPVEGQPERYQEIRATAFELARRVSVLCPPSRERSLAITNLEQAVMWANAAIARNEGGADE
jgi:hypothetical protein